MTAPFATGADVAAIWRTLTDEESTQADALAVVASAMVRAQVPSVDLRISRGHLDSALPRQVVASMVRRYLEARSPEDPIEEQTGPFRERWAQADNAVQLRLEPDDLVLLRPAASPRRAHQVGLGIPPP